MKEYISKNGIRMVNGYNFNWQKQPVYYHQQEPFVLTISVGNLSDPYICSYDLNTKMLSISLVSMDENCSLKFYARSLLFAEDVILGFIKGNDFEIPPLYKKEN